MAKHIKVSMLQFHEKRMDLELYFPYKTRFHYEDKDNFEAFDSWAKKDQDWRALVKLFKYMKIEVKKPKEPWVNELLIMDVLADYGYEVITVMRDEVEYTEVSKKQIEVSIYVRKANRKERC